MLALKIHPFKAMGTMISKSSRLAYKGGHRFEFNRDEWEPLIRQLFIEKAKIVSLPSCFNKEHKRFIKCKCLVLGRTHKV
jgi:hypothetical protein